MRTEIRFAKHLVQWLAVCNKLVINSPISFFLSPSSLLPVSLFIFPLSLFLSLSYFLLSPPVPQYQPPAPPAPLDIVLPLWIKEPADLWFVGRAQNEDVKGLFIHTALFIKQCWKFPWLPDV